MSSTPRHRRALVFLLFVSGCRCESWSKYAREHNCVEIRRESRTCYMTNTVGFQDLGGGVEWPITMQVPYDCDDVVYQCDNGQVIR